MSSSQLLRVPAGLCRSLTPPPTVIGDPILVGRSPVDVAVTPGGTRAYVLNLTDGTSSVISIRLTTMQL